MLVPGGCLTSAFRPDAMTSYLSIIEDFTPKVLLNMYERMLQCVSLVVDQKRPMYVLMLCHRFSTELYCQEYHESSLYILHVKLHTVENLGKKRNLHNYVSVLHIMV